MDTSKFHDFFDCCVGQWKTERTYHYLTYQDVERSRTEFVVSPLTSTQKTQVLSDNGRPNHTDLDSLPGFHLEFETISEKGEQVSQQLNLLFIPTSSHGSILEGDYLRDRAYEEAKPMISHFRFDPDTRELLMTTNYTRVISVDSITLINPNLRIRKILNYQRPLTNQPLDQVVLVGFGVEQKVL